MSFLGYPRAEGNSEGGPEASLDSRLRGNDGGA